MGRFTISIAAILVAVCAATPSFASCVEGELMSNNVVTAAVEKRHAAPNADLEYLIGTITEHQSKKKKVFERKAKAYFFKDQKTEAIEVALKQYAPGEAVTAIVLSNLSKKPVQDIIDLKTSGMLWEDIAEQTGVKVKAVVSDVKDFRFGIG